MEVEDMSYETKIQETKDLLKELDEINAMLINVINNIKDENVKKQEIRKFREKKKLVAE